MAIVRPISVEPPIATTTTTTTTMDESLDLPQAAIVRIVKAALPKNFQVGKECRLALAKAANIWVLYLSAAASDIATSKKRKTISADDVLAALAEMDFHEFIAPLGKLRQDMSTQSSSKRAKKGDAIGRDADRERVPDGDPAAAIDSDDRDADDLDADDRDADDRDPDDRDAEDSDALNDQERSAMDRDEAADSDGDADADEPPLILPEEDLTPEDQ